MIANDENRDPVELLAEEFLLLKRKGIRVTIDQYEHRYPELADQIKEVFPALLAMESAKPREILAPAIDSFDAVAQGKITRLGDFRIIRKIAQGGMGIVYEAEEVSLDRKVAIKVLPANLISDQSALERFQREAKTIARLHHTNIVSVYGAGFENEVYFFVMEYIDGKSLDRLIQSGQFKKDFAGDWDWIAEVSKRIALALRHAHDKNILHRDVKPGNILIDADRKAWITDFGLAKFEDYDDLTRPGDAVGTLRYMAPEQMKGTADCRADVFGLGLVLYEMLTGAKVYGDAETQNLLARIKERDLPPPSRTNPSIPTDLEMIALKAIAIDPEDRYQTAVEMADDLDRWQNDLAIRARPLTTLQMLQRWAKRNPVIAGLSSMVIGLLVVMLISFGVIAFAWLGEHSARLDARISQLAAEESRKDAEKSVTMAISALDQLSTDLGVFNRIGEPTPGNQSFLFSPLGGIPVSRKTEAQLDAIHDFYESIGRWSDQRVEIQFRSLVAQTRSAEISLHMRDYDQAKLDLEQLVNRLRSETDSKLIGLRLYANYLMAYAHLLSRDYSAATSYFDEQMGLIDALEIDAAEKGIERGKVFLGQGILAHYQGKVRRWHDCLMQAINEFESQVDWQHPEKMPVPAVFLARCYLNVPPRFSTPGYAEFYQDCIKRSVAILHRLNQWQASKANGESELASLLFFFDYCEAVSSLPPEVGDISIGGKEQLSVVNLLDETIAACKDIVKTSPDIPAFKFALAKCQMNLALRRSKSFKKYSGQSLANLNELVGECPKDPSFLTERGLVLYQAGLNHLASREFESAKKYFEKSIADLDASLTYSYRYPKTQVILPLAHGKLAYVYGELDEPKPAAYHRNREKMFRKQFPHPNPERPRPKHAFE